MAIEYPDRVRSLTSMMSTTGDPAVAERAGLAYDRSYDPAGAMRQLVAAVASGDRTARLRSVRMPTLVIHGTSDPVIDVSGGRATAAAIPGAELIVIDGMGHNFPPGLWDELTSRIAELAKGTERAGARRTGT